MPEQKPILIIDARNIMYRAIYAGKNEDRRNPARRRSPFLIMLRMISSWIRRYKPAMVQLFWDAPRGTVWRRALLSGYKDRQDDHGGSRDISGDLVLTERIARSAFQLLNVYQFYRDKQEADDLIYAACKLQQGTRSMILISSDGDMQQIPFYMDSVRIYHPDKGVELPRPTTNPALIKALEGCDSDNVPGYSGVGPVTAGKLVASPSLLQEHLTSRGCSTYRRNLALVDMSLNPYMISNLLYVGTVLATTPRFDRGGLMALERTMKISGLTQDYGEVVGPFRDIPNR